MISIAEMIPPRNDEKLPVGCNRQHAATNNLSTSQHIAPQPVVFVLGLRTLIFCQVWLNGKYNNRDKIQDPPLLLDWAGQVFWL